MTAPHLALALLSAARATFVIGAAGLCLASCSQVRSNPETEGVGGAAGSGGASGAGAGGPGGAGPGGSAGVGAAAGAAGTGGAAGSSGGGGGAGAGGAPDNDPPRVVSTSPSDGDIGLAADAVLVVQFSEPMDQASVSQAFASPDAAIQAAGLTWNAAGDTLTITPSSGLALEAGGYPIVVTARHYAYGISTSARDIAGNALGDPLSVGFSTLRRISHSLSRSSSYTGSVLANGFTANDRIAAGDSESAPNAQYKGFITIQMNALPQGIIMFESASLKATQNVVTGTPYIALGELRLYSVRFASLDLVAFNAPLGTDLGEFSTSALQTQRSKDVRDVLAADYAERSTLLNRSQYSLQFTIASDLDGVADTAEYDPASVSLETVYLLP